MRKIQAVFLDRDGVVNEYLPDRYVEKPDELHLLPGIPAAVRRLNDAGIKVIIISNQQGVGKGLMTTEALDAVTDTLKALLAEEAGAHIDDAYFCTHVKADDCACRKPKPGMILSAAAKLGISIPETLFIGDSSSDMEAAAAAGVPHRAFVLTGANRFYDESKFEAKPNLVFSSLMDAVDWILEN